MAHRFVEHVGEVELELEAETEEGIFDAALAAFADLVAADGRGEPATHEIELSARDRGLLLVDWLSELVFLAEVARFVPERIVSLKLADGRLAATVAGRRGSPRHLVKAVTLNRLVFGPEGAMWHGRVVVDV
jgi:SHS2 domain-containing protein